MYLFGICGFTAYGVQPFVLENGWSWHALVFFFYLYFNIFLILQYISNISKKKELICKKSKHKMEKKNTTTKLQAKKR